MTTHNHEANMTHMQHMAQANQLANPADATHVAIKSGNWSDPSTWEGGRVPGAEARVLIPEDAIVTYDVDSDVPLATVRVDGHLKWATNKNTDMLVETIVTSHGSKIEIGSSDNPINDNVDATITFRDTPINLSKDPDQLSHGLVAFGEVDVQGAAKESHLTLEGSVNRGDRSIKVDGDLDNWEVGDTILLVGTGNGSRDEERTITGINGDTITFDRALSYNHNAPDGFDFDTFVGNLSRNVTFRSENPEGVRGHVMLHNGTPNADDGSINDVRYAAFEEMGRTDTLIKTGTATNPIGRYPLHLHETGTGPDDAASVLEGNAINGSDGWGIVQHGSRAMVNGNIVYDVAGSGIISETGNETGMWIGNLVSSVQGSDVLDEDNRFPQVGSEGAAYENQSRVIIQQDNIAANAELGWNFSGREDFRLGPTKDGEHRKMFEREQLPFDPSPFDVAIDHEEPPLVDFNNNTVIASDVGMRVFHRQTSDDTDTQSVLRNFDIWGGSNGVKLSNYSSNYLFIDSTWQGSNEAFTIARKTSSAVFNNVDIHDFAVGYKSKGVNHESVLIDTEFHNVKQVWDLYDLMINVTDNSLRQELIRRFRDEHGIDYANPLPKIVDSSDLTPVDRITFTPDPGSDMTLKPKESILNFTGTITDSVGVRRYNEYVEAKPPKGTGFSKDFEGIKLRFGPGTDERKEEFTTDEFLTLHGAYQKADGSWVSPVVNWITDRLTGDQHPVIIEIKLEGWAPGALDKYKLDEYPDPGINNLGWFDGTSTPRPALDQTDDHAGHDNGGNHAGGDDGTEGTGGESTGGSSIRPELGEVEVLEPEPVEAPQEAAEEPADQSVPPAPTPEQQGPALGPSQPQTPTDGYVVVRGDDSDNRLSAGDEDSQLLGFAGRDQIVGGKGNDIIEGGAGGDRLTGGEGADTFVMGADAIDTGIDFIRDFSVAEGDLIDLSEVGVSFGLTPAELEDALNFRNLNHGVRIEVKVDGVLHKLAVIGGMTVESIKKSSPFILTPGETVASAPVEQPAPTTSSPVTTPVAAEVEATPPSNGNVLIGTNGRDLLEDGDGSTLILGKGGRDDIYGGGGNDTIDAGSGKDWVSGGAGSDTFVFGADTLDGNRTEVRDFSVADGDKVDLSAIKDAYGLSDDDMLDSITILGGQEGVRIKFEIDGTSHNIVKLHNTVGAEFIEAEALMI